MNLEEEIIGLKARITALEDRVSALPKRSSIGKERVEYIERQLSDHGKRIAELEAPPLLDTDVLSVGISRRKSEDAREVVDTIALLSEKGDGCAYIPDLVAVLMPALCIEDIAEVIKKLRRNGEIFEPRRGYLKLP